MGRVERRARLHRRDDSQFPGAGQPRPAPSPRQAGLQIRIQRLAVVAQSFRPAHQWTRHPGDARPILLRGLPGGSHGGARRQRIRQRGFRGGGEAARAGKAIGMVEPGVGQQFEPLDHRGAAPAHLRGGQRPRVRWPRFTRSMAWTWSCRATITPTPAATK